jgi:hypothetical protein
MPNIRSLLTALTISAFLVGPVMAKEKNAQSLPPGLAKNQARGKPLPPGWQKKLARGVVLETQVYDAGSVVVPVDNSGLLTIRVEGKLIRVMEKTREIVDILN